jgi:hypothetical protein
MAEQTHTKNGIADKESKASHAQHSNQDKNHRVVELDPILAAEAKHGPVFRRELFDAVYTVWNSLGDDTHSATVPNIYGEPCHIYVSRENEEMHHQGRKGILKRIWDYRSLQMLGEGYNQRSYDPSALCPYSFCRRFQDAEAERICCKAGEFKMEEQGWKKEWENSEMHHRLTTFLLNQARETLERVDKIICFGLGCLSGGRSCIGVGRRSYFQHLAARTIAETLAGQQHRDSIPIFAQDPVYCDTGISYITSASLFNITILDDPEGFRALDKHTFVMSFAPNVPVRQIVMGMTHDTDGPAALSCDGIDSDGLECKFMTCEPSPALWRYKQSSAWMEHSDWEAEQWFGKVGVYLKRRQ